MKNLLLIHGAWHNESCWKDAKLLLENKGYHVELVTLGGNEVNNKK